MERKIAFVFILSVGIASGLGVGVLFAQPVEPSNLAVARVDAGPAVKVRDWYDAADIVLRVVTIVVLSGGLLGTFVACECIQPDLLAISRRIVEARRASAPVRADETRRVHRQPSFSPKFNRFVKEEVLPPIA